MARHPCCGHAPLACHSLPPSLGMFLTVFLSSVFLCLSYSARCHRCLDSIPLVPTPQSHSDKGVMSPSQVVAPLQLEPLILPASCPPGFFSSRHHTILHAVAKFL